MLEQEKISVIVPVYGVEKYLRKAVDSLLCQTHRNLEIILVDDGSPDGSGAICDEYAAADARVTVIHKKNGGLFSAKNAGLDAATGDYVGFVDSDDWVEDDMFSYLLAAIHQYHADVSTCGMWYDYETSSVLSACSEVTVVKGREADQMTVEEKLKPSSCNKLFRRELWDGLRFFEVRIGEDLLGTRMICERAETIVCMPEGKYHYMQRQGSLTQTQSLKKWIGYFDDCKALYDKLAVESPGREKYVGPLCLYCAKYLWCVYTYATAEEKSASRAKILEIVRFCSPWIPEEIRRRKLGALGRVALKTMQYPHSWALGVAGVVSRVYEKKHGSLLTLQ